MFQRHALTMCGIGFLFDQVSSRQECEIRMQACLAAQQHRGPDDGRIEVIGNAVLGHRRLSIIDLAASKQPMSDPSGRYCLSFNGEIYNYIDVRKYIEDRWVFNTQGDTEVLLAGLVLDGIGFLDGLEGMWAFALWDAFEQRLLLGRDRMGKKPVFFHLLKGGGIACASELPALRTLSTEAWHEDEHSTADFLRYGYSLPGYTAWREVGEVRPGHVATWEPAGEVRQQPWWVLQPRCFDGGKEKAGELLSDALISSVEKRMVADVEVGAFLSGGVDSSLVCAIIRQDLKRSLKTFTIGFEDANFDERQYARLAAEALNTDHYEEVLGGWDESELERLLLSHVGQPFADASLLPTSLVSSVAAKYVKVALSGDGGDELFCGYERYQARNILRWYTRLPNGMRYLAEKAVRMLPEPMAHHSRSLLKKAHLFMDVVDRQKAETPYFAPTMFSPQQYAELVPDLADMGHQPPGIPEQTEPDDIARMMLADALIYLPQDILVKVDRASMAHALETRAPFLDRKVIELAFSMPRQWHRHQGSGKQMLYKVFSNKLPNTLWKRRKQGFGVPIHQWFRNGLEDKLRSLSASVVSSVDVAAVDALIRAHNFGGRDYGYRLWTVYIYLLWKYKNR